MIAALEQVGSTDACGWFEFLSRESGDRNLGRYVAIQLEEGTELIDTAEQGSSAARNAQATLEISMRPAGPAEPPMQTPVARFPTQELEPAAGVSGPDLF